ncbi:MAG: hypothetical protein HFI99_17060 [Lachnospiraceae bacterium]|jgi:hypothetical protein|nr:hypothetical protein [Lachnospiraceae bacterium]
MRNDLIRAILECGIDDLSMLDDSGADMYNTVERIKEEGLPISLDMIIGEIFKEGIFQMGEAVRKKREELEQKEKQEALNEAEYEQLEAIRLHNLNPKDDFHYYLNCKDTHLYCDESKQEVYEEMFEQEMQNLMDYTGFDVE